MVSLWPWKADDTASFEKTLATLTSKLSKSGVKLNKLKARSRRFKALWTLYTTLAFIFGSLILVLVTGWRNWNSTEYAIIAGSPPIIYSVRLGLDKYYSYRISSAQSQLDDLNQQRAIAIEKFKNATKFNSTQKLLEKYGAAPSSSGTSTSTSKSSAAMTKRQPSGPANRPQQRTGLPPPPTANIPRVERLSQSPNPQSAAPSPAISRLNTAPTEEFAPNAFSPSPRDYALSGSPSFQPSHSVSESSTTQDHHIPRWYDRFLDVLLGEDETRAANRLALICSNCRLVNGRAPPGVQRLEDVGKWRCSECGIWNGVESEVRKMIQAVGRSQGNENSPALYRELPGDDDGMKAAMPEMRQKDKLDGAEDDIDESVDEDGSVILQEEEEDTDLDDTDQGQTSVQEDDGDVTDASYAIGSSPARSTRSKTKKTR